MAAPAIFKSSITQIMPIVWWPLGHYILSTHVFIFLISVFVMMMIV